MKRKKLYPALFAIALGLTIPTLSSCSDDDDNKDNKLGVEYYSADAAKTYLHDAFVDSKNSLHSVDVSETQFATLQSIHSYFHEKYGDYTIDGGSQVFTPKELLEKLKKVVNGEVSASEIRAKLEAAAGTYTPDDATKKWVKTEETPGVIKLAFKDKNGKDAAITVSGTNLGTVGGGVVQTITGENLNFSISLLDINPGNNSTITRIQLGRFKITSTSMSSKNGKTKSTIIYMDDNPLVNKTQTSSGKNLNDAVLNNNEYEKVVTRSVVFDKVVIVRTNNNYQAVKEAVTKKYASQEEKLQAVANAMNANMKSIIFDNKGKLLFTTTKVVKKDGNNTYFSDQFTAGEGTVFQMGDFFYDQNTLQIFSQRMNGIYEMIKNLGADVDITL